MISTTSNATNTNHKLVLEGIIWTILIAIAWWGTLTATRQEFQPVIIFTSLVSLASGIRVFLGHGHGRISATGLFSLSTAMFIGYSGLLLVSEGPPRAGWENLAIACALGLTAQVATSLLAWRSSSYFTSTPFRADTSVTSWLFKAGLTALGLAFLAHIALPNLRGLSSAAAFTAIFVLSAGIILRKKVRFFSWSTLAIMGLIFLYSEYFHAGTGRLHIVALACAIAILISARFPDRRLKFGILLAIPFAIAWMAFDRLVLEESLASGASEGRTGLESMIAPLNIFSLLLEALREGEFQPSFGYNLLSVPALIIPESVWPNQPRALGYELVQFGNPSRYGDGIFSTVATSTGEAIFNFGWLGLPLVIFFTTIVLRVLDDRLNFQPTYASKTVVGVLGVILLAMLAGAIADYTWSGVHTYTARMLTRLPVFLVILIFALLQDRSKDSYTSKAS